MSFRNVKAFVPAVDAGSLALEVRKSRLPARRSDASKTELLELFEGDYQEKLCR
jgi:hypothetical protein